MLFSAISFAFVGVTAALVSEDHCFRRRVLSSLLLRLPILLPSPTVARTDTWEFANGSVQFDIPLRFPDDQLWEEVLLLGSGGGGAAFAVRPCSGDGSDGRQARCIVNPIVIKVSWENSAKSVQQECNILQLLESKGITENVEQCFASRLYSNSGRPERVMLALRPVFNTEQAASIADIDTLFGQQKAVQALVETCIRMLVIAHVATADVQLLISKETGDILWIDFTEAIEMSETDPSFSDFAVATSMTNEVASMIPDHLGSLARRCVIGERRRLEESIRSIEMSELMDHFEELFEP